MESKRVVASLVVFTVLLAGVNVYADLDSGPYLLNITETSVEVVCEGDGGDDPGVVQWGPTPDLDFTEDMQRRLFHDEMFTATLSGLSPASVYYYRVIHEGETSPLGSFYTPVAPGDHFSFVVIGDTRSNPLSHQLVVNAIIANGIPDLVFNSGDLVADGEDKDQWQQFFAIEEDLLRNCIFGPVWGNHENGSDLDLSRFNMYFTTGDSYTYRFGNAVFIVVNTEKACGVGGGQYNFLQGVLQEVEVDPDIDFKFLFFHKPAVTTSTGHDPNFAVLKGVMELCEEYGVHVVFTGHNHLYEHGIVNGVHHIVTGGGGAGLSGFIDPYDPDDWTIVHREKVHHFVEVSVSADQYTYTAMRTNLNVMDTYTATVADHGFPGPTPSDLLERANPLACSLAASPARVITDASALFNVALLLLPAVIVRIRARRKG